VNLIDAVAAVRALQHLPDQRRAALITQLMTAPTTGAWGKIVEQATAESRRNAYRSRAYVETRLAESMAADRRTEAPTAPSVPSARTYRSDIVPMPEARPVTVTFTTPRRPLVVRVQQRENSIHAPEVAAVKVRAEKSVKAKVQRPDPAPLPGIEHGLLGYNKFRCKCSTCADAKRASRVVKNPQGTRAAHGSISGYSQLKCRDGCPGDPITGETCREAKSRYTREHRQKKIAARSDNRNSETYT
jgi:hypothetical protein